jgi:hypothetical protein
MKKSKKKHDNEFIINPLPFSDGIDIHFYDEPIFSFKYLQEKSIEDCKDAKFFRDFLFRLKGISELGWKGAENSSRHGLGMEKIPRSIIKPDLPKIVTPDVTLVAFRASGNNLPFIGFRKNRNVFYVLYVETVFGDIYKHS